MLVFEEAFNFDSPNWVNDVVIPLRPKSEVSPEKPNNYGIPLSAYVTLRQMRLLDIGSGTLNFVKMSTIQNHKTMLQIEKYMSENNLTDITDIGDFIYETHSVKYAETILIQSGHKIENAYIEMGDLGERIQLSEIYQSSEVDFDLRKAFEVDMDDYFNFNIIIELQ